LRHTLLLPVMLPPVTVVHAEPFQYCTTCQVESSGLLLSKMLFVRESNDLACRIHIHAGYA
jgi:hypothetical protein